MPEQLITAISSSLAGGIIALAGVLLNNRSSTARLKAQFDHDDALRKAQVLRERGEELYVLIAKWLNTFAGHYLGVAAVMQGKLTYNQCLDLDIETLSNKSLEFSRIELLVDIYYPSTRKAYDEVMAGRSNVNEIEIAHKRAYGRGDIEGQRFLRSYVDAQKAIEAAGRVFKEELTKAIRAI